MLLYVYVPRSCIVWDISSRTFRENEPKNSNNKIICKKCKNVLNRLHRVRPDVLLLDLKQKKAKVLI